MEMMMTMMRCSHGQQAGVPGSSITLAFMTIFDVSCVKTKGAINACSHLHHAHSLLHDNTTYVTWSLIVTVFESCDLCAERQVESMF